VEVLPKNKPQLSQFSFSASKKVAQLAVKRNKLRRIGYSIIQKHIHEIQDGFQCFFMYKKTQSEPKFAQIENEALILLSNAGVLI
jgi:ribonuclease P protein component